MTDITAQVCVFLRSGLSGLGVTAPVTEYNRKQGIAPPQVMVTHLGTAQSFEKLAGAEGMDQTRIEVTAFNTSSATAHTLAEQIRGLMQGHRGAVGSSYAAGITSTGGFKKDYDDPIAGGNSRTYWVSREYVIIHN